MAGFSGSRSPTVDFSRGFSATCFTGVRRFYEQGKRFLHHTSPTGAEHAIR
jgi:hypothetical protein